MPYTTKQIRRDKPNRGDRVTMIVDRADMDEDGQLTQTVGGEFLGALQFVSYSGPYFGLLDADGMAHWCRTNDVREIVCKPAHTAVEQWEMNPRAEKHECSGQCEDCDDADCEDRDLTFEGQFAHGQLVGKEV